MPLPWSVEFDSQVRIKRIKTELAVLGEANYPGAEKIRPVIENTRQDIELASQRLRHQIAKLRVSSEQR